MKNFYSSPSATKHYYFGYGMNSNLDQMSARCPEAVCFGSAKLHGYKFVFRGHADVELDKSSTVQGVLWEVNNYDLESLDLLEGFPTYYLRQRAYVEIDNVEVVAWVYMMNDQSFVNNPSQSYYEMCYEGYIQNNIDTTQLFEALITA